LSHDQSELGQVTAQGVDELRALADKGLVRPKGDGTSLVLGALDGHVMQVRAQRRLGDRRRIRRIVLLPFDERLHVDRGDQPNFMPESLREPAPKMARGASFHGNDAGSLLAQKRLQLCARHCSVE
jgi:hypothetical protein